MRQWRVGTLTMGLVLVLSGIGLLYAQFDQAGVVGSIIKWWPVIFVLLGIEVLVQNYWKKDEGSGLRYDILSIIIVFFIVMTGLGLHTISELGLGQAIHNEINQQVFSVPAAQEVPLNPELKKVVLETGNGNVKLSTHSGSSILARSTIKVRAESSEQASARVDQNTLLTQQKAGNTLYLGFGSALDSDLVQYDLSLLVPNNIAVQLGLGGNSAEIDLDSLKNDWKINGPGRCAINLPTAADVTVTALLKDEKYLHGNLAWNITPSPSTTKQEEYDQGREQPMQAQAKLGNGTHRLDVIGINDLTINHLP